MYNVIENRFFRSDQWTVNGVTAYKFSTLMSSSATYIQSPIYSKRAYNYVDAKITVLHADGTETILLDWTQLYQSTTSESGYIHYTWNCPSTSLSPTDAIQFYIRARNGSAGSTVASAVTEQLGADALVAQTWAIQIYLNSVVSATTGSYIQLYFGDYAHNTGASFIVWTPHLVTLPPQPFSVSKPIAVKNSVPLHTHDTYPPVVVLPDKVRDVLPDHTHNHSLLLKPSPSYPVRKSILQHTHWLYRRPITIDNTQNSNNLTNYQIAVIFDSSSLISAGKLASDGRDLRFTDSDGKTLLPYWIESRPFNSSSARVWVKVPSIPANSTKTIYMYYGNPNATDQQNGKATFDFFDDFEGTSLDTTTWYTISGTYSVHDSVLDWMSGSCSLRNPLPFNLNDGYMVESRLAYVTSGESYYSGDLGICDQQFQSVAGNPGANASIHQMINSTSNSYDLLTWIASGSTTGYDVANGVTVESPIVYGEYHIRGDEATPSGAGIWKDYQRVLGYSFTWAKNPRYIIIGYFSTQAYDNKDVVYDWVRVRKYLPPEPTITVGSEET